MTKKLIMILDLVLSSMLMKAQVFFVPFPKAGDKYWQKQVPLAMRNDYIRLGNLYQKKPWNAIPNSMFAEFRTNGNRTRYEEASFGIRKQFDKGHRDHRFRLRPRSFTRSILQFMRHTLHRGLL